MNVKTARTLDIQIFLASGGPFNNVWNIPQATVIHFKSFLVANMTKNPILIISLIVLSRVLLDELEAHPDAWPFLTPVNHKAVPGYRKVIKKPMDFSTIREKLTNNQYVCVPDSGGF